MSVVELNHPLIEHKLAIIRDEKTGTKEFRELVSEIAMFLCYEKRRIRRSRSKNSNRKN